MQTGSFLENTKLQMTVSFTGIRVAGGLQSAAICWVALSMGGMGGGREEVEVACARQRQSSGNPVIMMATRRAALTMAHNLTDPNVT
jgi:hypothetical protein